jgi:putative hydrolase of the HAD superfamily
MDIETRNASSQSQTAAEIRAVILDYGEVLCHLPSAEHVARFGEIFRMDPHTFLPIYQSGRGPYDRGDVLADEYWKGFAAQAGVEIDARTIAEATQLDRDMWSSINEAMVQWIQEVHAAGYKTAILSNMPADMAAHFRKKFAWLGNFDQHIFSGDARSIKPDPAIYRHCLEALAVEPGQALFIDNLAENLEPARAIGIRTIHFQSMAQLRRDLQAIGFPILPR